MAFCPGCGQAAAGYAFCPECGTRLRGLSLNVPSQAGEPPEAAETVLPMPRVGEVRPSDWPPNSYLPPVPDRPVQPIPRTQADVLLPHGWTPASFGQRLGARVLDGLVVLAIVIALWIALATMLGHSDPATVGLGATLGLLAFVLLLPTVIGLVYYVLSDAGSGRSLGRAALGIRLVRLPVLHPAEMLPPDALVSRVGVGTAIGRLLVSALGDSVFWLSSLSVLWDPQRRSWGDRASGTAVIVDRYGERRSALLPPAVAVVLAAILCVGAIGMTRSSAPSFTATDSSTTTYGDSSGGSNPSSSSGTSDRSGSSSTTESGSSSPSGTGTSVPIESGDTDSNTWIAQLASVQAGDDSQLQAQYQAISAVIPNVKVVGSSDFASLTPGYWVIYYPGDFAEGTAAVDFCHQQGRSVPQSCFGRYLSHDTADRSLLCYGTPSSASEEVCSRHYRSR
jgi:uncharacterized RDD family membrane protein YckC